MSSSTTPASNPRIRRTDIDLLRAVAVSAVVLFHFEVPGFAGGFLGVDIFFVISGYLITLHINEQLASGSFDFANFYARRIRRLFPALIATFFASAIASLIILPKNLLADYAASLVAASAYVSNIYFWNEADYFDTQSILKPLLHTWSLSVEEQFYLIWPLLLMLAFRRRQTLLVLALGLASVVTAELLLTQYSSSAFYLFPFRVFEFAAGALASRVRPPQKHGVWTHLVLLTAAAIIGVTIYLTTEATRNPGFLSLPLCASVATIIALQHPWANPSGWTIRPLLRIGLVSYSAYLVHWPLVVLLKITRFEPLSSRTTFWLCIATYLLAEASYQFIEKPSSRISIKKHRNRLFALLPACLVFSLLFLFGYPYAYRFLANAGFNAEARIEVQAILDRIPDRKPMLESIEKQLTEKLALGSDTALRIVVMGDSHSLDMTLALQYLLSSTDFRVIIYHSVCDPLTPDSITIDQTTLYQNIGHDFVRNSDYCESYHNEMLDDVKRLEPDVIILSEDWRKPALPFVRQTLSDLKSYTKARVIVLGKNPVFLPDPAVVLRRASSPEKINAIASEYDFRQIDDIDEALRKAAAAANALFIRKYDLVCPSGQCDMLIDGEIGYVDSSHWSFAGMQLYGKRLLLHPAFQTAIDSASAPPALKQ